MGRWRCTREKWSLLGVSRGWCSAEMGENGVHTTLCSCFLAMAHHQVRQLLDDWIVAFIFVRLRWEREGGEGKLVTSFRLLHGRWSRAELLFRREDGALRCARYYGRIKLRGVDKRVVWVCLRGEMAREC